MKRYFIIILWFCLSYGVQAQESFTLSPDEFDTKLKATSSFQLVDVRTPEEFKEKHLKYALNIDYKGTEFNELITHLDKSKPVFVYCLSGARSAAAANIMREKGFKEVYEMDGGITKWLNRDKPVERAAKKSSTGLSLQEFNKLVDNNKLVLVDFKAKWCAPCKKMEPILEKIGKESAEKVKVVSVDVDANEAIAKHFKVAALPTLMLFKNSKQLSAHEGFLDEAGLLEWIGKFE